MKKKRGPEKIKTGISIRLIAPESGKEDERKKGNIVGGVAQEHTKWKLFANHAKKYKCSNMARENWHRAKASTSTTFKKNMTTIMKK